MPDYKVGVSVRETLPLVRFDSDYFEDDYEKLRFRNNSPCSGLEARRSPR